jgi:hypothetical protein
MVTFIQGAKRSRRHAANGLGGDVTDAVKTTLKDLFDSYRPELHYMRGPGPKWHAKHNQTHASEAPANGLPQAFA